MEKSHHITRICFGLLAVALIGSPHGVISMPCNNASSGQTVNAVRSNRTPAEAKSITPSNKAPMVASSTPSAIKKDLFMSRGWGASGMPFSMFYLNHYTKAQKAYAQNQQQQQLQQQQQQQQQEPQQQADQQQMQLQKQQQLQHEKERLLRIEQQPMEPMPGEMETDITNKASGNPVIPQTLPIGARYGPESEAVHAQQLRTDADYVDAAVPVRTTKVTTSRRQYTVPQLFVSYGWGPLG